MRLWREAGRKKEVGRLAFLSLSVRRRQPERSFSLGIGSIFRQRPANKSATHVSLSQSWALHSPDLHRFSRHSGNGPLIDNAPPARRHNHDGEPIATRCTQTIRPSALARPFAQANLRLIAGSITERQLLASSRTIRTSSDTLSLAALKDCK